MGASLVTSVLSPFPSSRRLSRSPMTIARLEKFRFPDQSPSADDRVFFMSPRTLEDSPDGLEKSQTRAASFPCSKFYCWFYVRELVDQDEQLPVGHVSRLFRVASSFVFFSLYSFFPPPILSVFFPRRTRLSSSWPLSYVRLFDRARARARYSFTIARHYARSFKGTSRDAS